MLTNPNYLSVDPSYVGFNEIDFGWGKATYGGPAIGGIDLIPRVGNYYIRSKNQKGEYGIVVSVCLPSRR